MLSLRARCAVDDSAVSALLATASHSDLAPTPWSARLERHSVSWVCAFAGDELVGFVHAVWDGGDRAFVVDTVVHPTWQRQGLGTLLVAGLVEDCKNRGIRWLHAQSTDGLSPFYRACGFTETAAGVIQLSHTAP